MAASYEFSQRLASRINDRHAHKRSVRTTSIAPGLFDMFAGLMQLPA